jgi:hypothetical protein
MIVFRSAKTIPELWVALAVSVCAAVVFYFSTNPTLHDLDYTTEIASALLRGHVGLRETPPEWLNEMIPRDNRYYSAFPLGAVLSMIPIALLQKAHLIQNFPSRVLAALIVGCCVYFFFQLARAFGPDYSSLERGSLGRRIMLALFPIFGTWTWCNLGMGGAWQIALGLALLGETAALYFTLVRPSPFVAGAFFTLAFGNRTELLITAPLYLYLFWRCPNGNAFRWSRLRAIKTEFRENRSAIIRFLSLPVTLALLTAAYNFTRFHSILDFGYMHIPEVRDESWYKHGLFSIQAIPWNIYTMLFQGFESLSYFPYILPNGFGCSIFLASPFLCLLFREGGKYKIAAWVAIAVLTLVLWCHGNPGSWQFAYRYAMILLPWMFLVLTGNGPPRVTMIEMALFTVSVGINALATWLFLWTEKIQP